MLKNTYVRYSPMLKKQYDVLSDKSILNWDEAIPLGNGRLGTLVYGNGPIRLSVDRTDLWDNRQHPLTQDPGFNFQNLVRLVRSGLEEDWKESQRIFESINRLPYPTKLTAGRIELDFGITTDRISSYLSLRDAVATVQVDGGKVGRAEIFMSATEFVGVARIYGDYSLGLRLPKYLSEEAEKGQLENSVTKSLGYPPAEIITDGEFTYYKQQTLTNTSFGIVVLTKKCDGYSELYYTVASSLDAPDYIEYAKGELLRTAQIGYDALKRKHVRWWHAYWKKSVIDLPDPLLERTYYRSYYLFASCSRKGFSPAPLQGVWTADNDALPPWKGDYHHDLNTQLQYQSFLKANHLAEGESFIDYLWKMRDAFRAHAKEFYGVDGLLISGTTDHDGHPLGGWQQYSYLPTSAIWVAQSFDEYYLYTGDENFLRERAYPFLKEMGDAIIALLEEKDGKLYMPLSASPEIFDNAREAYLQPNTNYDLALLIYLFKTLKGYVEHLGIEDSRYDDILGKLDKFAIAPDGTLMLDREKKLHESHRHHSHLMALYPLHLINYDTEEHKRIYRASLLQMDTLGTGNWTGFSFGWAAQLFAMALNGNAAYEKLRMFALAFVSDNGFHLNGDFKNYGFSHYKYRPFTLESLYAYCDAIQEMLLQNHQGYLHIFPAVPECWGGNASFRHLRVYGGILVSAQMKGGEVKRIMLEGGIPQTVRIKNTFADSAILISKDGKDISIKANLGEIIEVYHDGGITEITLQG